MKYKVFLITCLLSLWTVGAQATGLFEVTNEGTPLPVAQAYQLDVTRTDNNIIAHWTIADGYYLYQDRFCFELQNQRLHQIDLPPAIEHSDTVLGRFKTYAHELTVTVPIPAAMLSQPLQFKTCYQGCSSHHFCYPPMTATVSLPPTVTTAMPVMGTQATPTSTNSPTTANNNQFSNLLTSDHLWLSLSGFFLIGLLLAFTPCVLPMIPILSGLILGHQRITTLHAFWISLTYVLAMALTYAGIGILAGLAGKNLQVMLQTPWAIMGLALVCIVLSLSLFGLYEIRLPARMEGQLVEYSNHQKSGSYMGAAVMGVLATLIVSPCVTPPLLGAITYITQTGSASLGGLALFIMALGMGLPLVIVGTFGSHLLSRTAQWSDTIKQVFGVLMLGVALLLIGRVVPARIMLLLWGALLVVLSVYLGLLQPAQNGWRKLWRGLGLLAAILGSILLLGAAQGNSDLWQPLTPINANAISATPATTAPLFTVVHNETELNQAFLQAQKNHQMIMLDFYAHWCLSCATMERFTFNNPKVVAALKSWQVLRIDITTPSPFVQKIMQQYGVIAPPTVLFFNSAGQEIPNSRVIGEMDFTTFLAKLSVLSNGG